MDLGMAGEDRFNQCAAGTRHTNDEDRQWRWIACILKAVKQAGTEHIGDPTELRCILRFMIVDLLPLQGIALVQMLKGAGIIPDVVERFTECEMNVKPFVGGKMVHFGGKG